MNDFINRVDAQRTVLNLANAHTREREELFGLSEKAIHRWESANSLDPGQPLSVALRDVSIALQFLANKSQEAVTEEYQAKSSQVFLLIDRVRAILLRTNG
ncbi:hypothetical protein ACVWWJ_001583 [Luteibacter sp. HA06]|jgi:hypothetical protein